MGGARYGAGVERGRCARPHGCTGNRPAGPTPPVTQGCLPVGGPAPAAAHQHGDAIAQRNIPPQPRHGAARHLLLASSSGLGGPLPTRTRPAPRPAALWFRLAHSAEGRGRTWRLRSPLAWREGVESAPCSAAAGRAVPARAAPPRPGQTRARHKHGVSAGLLCAPGMVPWPLLHFRWLTQVTGESRNTFRPDTCPAITPR